MSDQTARRPRCGKDVSEGAHTCKPYTNDPGNAELDEMKNELKHLAEDGAASFFAFEDSLEASTLEREGDKDGSCMAEVLDHLETQRELVAIGGLGYFSAKTVWAADQLLAHIKSLTSQLEAARKGWADETRHHGSLWAHTAERLANQEAEWEAQLKAAKKDRDEALEGMAQMCDAIAAHGDEDVRDDARDTARRMREKIAALRTSPGGATT